MADISISAVVSRDNLALSDLDINDKTNYVVAGPEVFGGNVTWDRKQVSSPVVDGEVTTYRRKMNVQDNLAVYVSADTQANLFTKIRTLIDAFTQDRYTLQFNIGGAVIQWDCESADYSVQIDNAHMKAMYAKVTFMFIRKPNALSGGY